MAGGRTRSRVHVHGPVRSDRGDVRVQPDLISGRCGRHWWIALVIIVLMSVLPGTAARSHPTTPCDSEKVVPADNDGLWADCEALWEFYTSLKQTVYATTSHPPTSYTHTFHPLSTIVIHTIVESGWNVWVWLVGVVSRRWVWLAGECVYSGCVCKEVYRFPHITYPYSSCICSFL